MSGPFATYFGNQRTVALPITPTFHNILNLTGAATTNFGVILLSAANTTAGTVRAYCYYAGVNPRATAAAASLSVTFAWQFQNAAHAAVGGASAIFIGSAASGPANGVLSPMPPFLPSWPASYNLAIPATAVEIAAQAIVFGVVGAPSVDAFIGWGIDVLNTGPTGDIGGGGLVPQGANNPNAF